MRLRHGWDGRDANDLCGFFVGDGDFQPLDAGGDEISVGGSHDAYRRVGRCLMSLQPTVHGRCVPYGKIG